MLLNLDWQDFEISEGLTCRVKPLEFWAFQKMVGIFQKDYMEEGDVESAKKKLMESNPINNPELEVVTADVLPHHAKDLKGLEIITEGSGGEKREATIEDLVTISQLKMLSIQVLMQIFSISSVMGAERKELGKQLPGSSESKTQEKTSITTGPLSNG